MKNKEMYGLLVNSPLVYSQGFILLPNQKLFLICKEENVITSLKKGLLGKEHFHIQKYKKLSFDKFGVFDIKQMNRV